MAYIISLHNAWKDASFIKCSGAQRWDQKFVSVCTARMKSRFRIGGYRLSVLLCFIVQEESNKVRTLTVRREREVNGEGLVTEGQYNWICSCDVRRGGIGLFDSLCWHARCLRMQEGIEGKVTSILETGFGADNGMYYGEMLNIEESGSNGTDGSYTLRCNGTEFTREEQLHGIVAIQLDKVTKKDIVERGKRIARR